MDVLNLTRNFGQQDNRQENCISRRSWEIGDSRIETRIHRIFDWAAAVAATRRFFVMLMGGRFCAAVNRRDKTGILKQAVA